MRKFFYASDIGDLGKALAEARELKRNRLA